jgi:hypothetical protein
MIASLFLRSVLVAAGLCTLSLAQHAEGIQEAFGVSKVEGGVWAGGADYSARFDERGIEFLPRHGGDGERAHALRFRLESVQRGAVSVFERTANVAPEITGNRVGYSHRAGPTEVYDVRADGIEQSFVFETKPAGAGALVVRGSITTDLPLAAASDEGVRYELSGVAGVTFGAVTGVDANGAKVRGSIRVADGGAHVEWVLPAAFVEGAAYPLVLDPLIGSVISIASTAGATDLTPAVAFDAGTSRYLTAWCSDVGAANGAGPVRAQFVTASGAVIGSPLVVATAARVDHGVAIANVHATDRFLVCWAEVVIGGSNNQWNLMMRSVRATDGSMSAAVQLASYLVSSSVADGGSRFDVGGESRPGSPGTAEDALVVWRAKSTSIAPFTIYTQFVHVPAGGNPVPVGSPAVAATNPLVSGALDEVAISRHGGAAGRWAIAWTSAASVASPTLMNRLSVRIVDTAGPCSAPAVVTTLAPPFALNGPTCATGDTNFAVSWRDSGGLQVVPFTYAGSCPGTLALGAIVNATTLSGFDRDPSLDFAGDKYVLAFRNQIPASSSGRVHVKGLDPTTCATCGLDWQVDTHVSSQETPAIVAQRSGSPGASDAALVVWSNGTIRGRRFEARSNDVVTAMGGACSLTGFDDFATFNGDAVLGSTDFELVLASPVSLPLILVLGFGNLSAPCGSCTIVPTLDILLPAINPYPLAIPCDPLLVGVDLYTQWVLLKPSDCPILPDLAFSNALRFTIGE